MRLCKGPCRSTDRHSHMVTARSRHAEAHDLAKPAPVATTPAAAPKMAPAQTVPHKRPVLNVSTDGYSESNPA